MKLISIQIINLKILFVIFSSLNTIDIISTIATSNDTITETMEVSPGEWKMMLGANRPPTDDDYLYVIGPNARMNIVYTNPPKPNCETCAIEISLRFWANWNRTKFPIVKDGTALFRIAVMPCHRSMPATKFIRFDDFDPSTWNYAVYTASKNTEFNFKCDKKVDIDVSDNEDCLDKITPEDEYLVAIKDLHMKYYCFMPTVENLLSNETCMGTSSYETPIRCVDVVCNKNDCPPSFSIQGGSWSQDNLPDRVKEYEDFWYTNQDLKTLTLYLTERSDSISCVSIAYWIAGKSSLNIEIGLTTINLNSKMVKSNSLDRVKYTWETIKLCPRQFNQKTGDSSPWERSNITFTSHTSSANDLIAIAVTPTNKSWNPRYENINNYLHHFSRPQAAEEWFIIPPFLNASSQISSPFIIELTFPSHTEGTGLIFSKWFKYSSGLKFRGTLKLDELHGDFSITLSLHTSNKKPVFSQNIFTLSRDSPLSSSTNRRLGIKLDANSFDIGVIKKSNPCLIMINVVYNTTSESKLTLSDVDVGDGCRESEVVCMDHGTCINMEADQYRCSCDQGWTGSHCQKINFCQAVDPETGLTGDQFCEQSEGNCDPGIYSPMGHTCSCERMRYWKLISSLDSTDLIDADYNDNKSSPVVRGHCEPVAKCVGLFDLCSVGYACDEDFWSSEKPCQICNRAMGYTMFDGQCVKIDACYKKCGTAKCHSLNANHYCYCDEKQELGEDGQSCRPRQRCTVWDSQRLMCSHGCEIVNGNPKCTCKEGHILSALDGKSCEPMFNCTVTCPEGSICIYDKDSDSSQCNCPIGWEWDDIASKCVDICKLADRGHSKWRDYVHDSCGSNRCNVINNEIRCICSPPTITNREGLCELEKICLPGNRGNFDCAGRNALCEPKSDGVTFTYRCLCPPGKAFDHGVCIDQCIDKKYECAAMNAVCRIIEDETSGTSVASCACRPGFVMESDYCYLAQHTIKATFTAKVIDTKLAVYTEAIDHFWGSFCSNINPKFLRDCHLYTRGVVSQWLSVVMETSLDRIITRYVDSILSPDVRKFANQVVDSVTLIDYKKYTREMVPPAKDSDPNSPKSRSNPTQSTSDYNITISLQLKNKPTGHPSILRMLCDDVFSLDDPRHDYCLIPSQTLIRRGTIKESDLIPCKEKMIDYCPENTVCVSDYDETRFRCVCNPGFVPHSVVKLDKSNTKLNKQYCIDLDECNQGLSNCPLHSACVNTKGSYNCVCQDNFIDDQGTCKELCEYQACQYGECAIISNHSAICRCDSWHVGDKCEMNNKVALFWRAMTILVAVGLTSIIIIFIVASISVARRSVKHQKATITYELSKTTAVENGYLKNRIELTDSMYMKNIRPSARAMGGRREPISSNFDPQMR